MKSIIKTILLLSAIFLFLLSFTSCKTSEIEELRERVEELESQLEGEGQDIETEDMSKEVKEKEVTVESDEIEYYKDKIEIINLDMAQIMGYLYDYISKRSKEEISEEDLFDMVISIPIYIDETYTKFLRIQPPDRIENIHSIYEKAFEYYFAGAAQLNLSTKDTPNKVDSEYLEEGLSYFNKADMLKENVILALYNPDKRDEIFAEVEGELEVVVDIPETKTAKELAEKPEEPVYEDTKNEESIKSSSEEEVLKEIMEKAKNDWPNDKDMQDFQYENQVQAYYEILDLTNTSDYRQEILTKAQEDWPEDYEMQLFQYENQLEAYHVIQNLPCTSNYRQDILDKSSDDWPRDYEMQLFQYNNQLEAYIEIQNLLNASDYNKEALSRAKSDWPRDYEMQLWQYNNEK